MFPAIVLNEVIVCWRKWNRISRWYSNV